MLKVCIAYARFEMPIVRPELPHLAARNTQPQ